TTHEFFDQLRLMLLLLQYAAVTQLNRDLCPFAIKEELRQSALPIPGHRIFELPLGACYGRLRNRPKILGLRQGKSEPRPSHGHDDIGLVWWEDQVLEMVGCEKRLALPQESLQAKMIGEFACESIHDTLCDETLWTHVRWRRHKYTNRAAFGHVV